MTVCSRRAVIGGVLAGLAGLSASVRAGNSIEAPRGPMLLSRTLVRGLPDGNRIEVSRSWQIMFTPRESGLAITGRQIAVEVDAPQKLDRIAAIERGRFTDNQFPILIDSSGLIIAAGEAESAADVERAIDTALAIAAEKDSPETEQQSLRSALAQIQAAGNSLLDRLPRDLFFPRHNGFSDKRDITLPDGRSGQIEVSYSATLQPLTGLLDRADRRIVTHLGSMSQVSSEHWDLRAI